MKVVLEELKDLNDKTSPRISGVLKRKAQCHPAKLPVRKYQRQMQMYFNTASEFSSLITQVRHEKNLLVLQG